MLVKRSILKSSCGRVARGLNGLIFLPPELRLPPFSKMEGNVSFEISDWIWKRGTHHYHESWEHGDLWEFQKGLSSFFEAFLRLLLRSYSTKPEPELLSNNKKKLVVTNLHVLFSFLISNHQYHNLISNFCPPSFNCQKNCLIGLFILWELRYCSLSSWSKFHDLNISSRQIY